MEKNPWIAVLLSFLIVGLGQVYNGQILKGLILFICAIVTGLLTFILIGWILLPILWVINLYDAYITAQDINAGRL
ncbi:hypothetical protein [Methanobacterium spitsbergense]|uniref:TM2 domain-containing protein n=1 Tax=Methanobacterium spitsbergense TaxID=2874285 RepID=A0A8T5V2K7_9EURY|nr:hypothetical protein [Methanobacterium spitsbergense]MBZ2165905.1 hypothetical protein [Methanobacterium spitsbergense]